MARVRPPGVADLLRSCERRTGLTALGLSVIAVSAAALVLGRVIANPGLVVVGLLGLTVVLLTWLTTGRRLAITATREQLPTRVQAGRIISGGFEVTANRTVRGLTMHEHIPAALSHDVRVSLPSVAAGRAVPHTYRMEARHRGVFTIGPLVAEISDAFGLVRRHRELLPVTELTVHPRTDAVIDRITARRWEDPVVRPPASVPWPTGAEYYGMHEYQPGDDPRRIVWTAVARTDTYLVREAEQGVSDRVTILLDTSVSAHGEADVSDSFETAVRAAASVADNHLWNGFSVAVEGNEGTLFSRARGRAHRLALLDALASATRGPSALRATLDRLLLDRSADGHFVIVTSRIDAQTAFALRLFITPGRSMVIVLTTNELTDAATWRHAAALRCPVVDVLGDEHLRRPFEYAIGIGARR